MRLKLILRAVFVFFLLNALSWAETVTVITKQNAIRESPRFFSAVKAYVKYGDILNVINIEKDWYRVKFRNISGYIHKTAVQERTFSNYGSYSPSTTSSEAEITLAGKGFNPQVEKVYKNQHPQMRYDLVDRIERYDISEKELASFIKAGGLSEP